MQRTDRRPLGPRAKKLSGLPKGGFRRPDGTIEVSARSQADPRLVVTAHMFEKPDLQRLAKAMLEEGMRQHRVATGQEDDVDNACCDRCG